MTLTKTMIPTRAKSIQIKKDTMFDMVAEIKDAYGRPVDVSGWEWHFTCGYLGISQYTDITNYISITGTVPSDADAAKGRFLLRVPDTTINQIATDIPVGVMAKWRLFLTAANGDHHLVYEGPAGITH